MFDFLVDKVNAYQCNLLMENYNKETHEYIVYKKIIDSAKLCCGHVLLEFKIPNDITLELLEKGFHVETIKTNFCEQTFIKWR